MKTGAEIASRVLFSAVRPNKKINSAVCYCNRAENRIQ